MRFLYYLIIAFIFLQLSVSAQQTTPKDTVSNIINMDDVVVMSSFAKQKINEPITISTVNSEQISNKLSNQEFPEILKSTPAIFATKTGGGFGDSRITLRGFGSENIGVLINGIPINGMENGSIYWSNWSGLADVANSIQVQRGIGLSKLGLFSVGGTISIITNGAKTKRESWVYYGVGNDGYQKMGISVASGQSKNGWAATIMGTRTTGNGYVKGTNFEGWSYFADISKRINASHSLSLTAFGAPQWHNRRSNKQSIEDYKNHPDGIKMNTCYGYIDGKLTSTYSGYNKYHKPQISLNHYWHINVNSSLRTSIYASIATGGGRKVYGKDANRIQYNFKNGKPNANTDLTPEGLIDYAPLIESNRISDHGSDAIFTMGTNSHNWYGLISTYTNNLNNNLEFTAGLDARYYKGNHFDEITDLLGGSYYKDNKLAWRNPATELKVGDKVSQDYFSRILWLGGFTQLAYTKNNVNAFVSLAVTNHLYKREDPGKYGKFGNQTNYPESMIATSWKKFVPISLKTGANYRITDKHRVYINGGYVTRAPMLENVYNDNNTLDDTVNEKIVTVEVGYSFTTTTFNATLNAYYTRWKDKSATKPIGSWDGPKACIPNLDAIHKGIELEVDYAPIPSLLLEGHVSIGDWRWANNVNFIYYDQNNEKKGEYNAYIKGIHVGNAPQTSAAISVSWNPIKQARIGVDFNYYDRYYAEFSAIDRTNPNDTQDSWKLPSFSTIDLNLNYNIKVGKTNFNIFGNINNLFDKEYIADALDGIEHDSQSALVWYGFGRTWTVGVKFSF